MSGKQSVTEKIIMRAEDTKRNRITMKYMKIEEGELWKPNKFDDEVMFYFLNGRGYAFAYMQMHSAGLSWMITPDTALWLPHESPFHIKNSGVGELQCVVASAKVENEEGRLTSPYLVTLSNAYKLHERLHLVDLFWRASDIEKFGGENLFDFELNTFHLGFSTRRHLSPPGAEEIVYVIRGEGEVEVEENNYPVKPGSLVYIPPNSIHRVVRHDEEDMFQYLVWIYLSKSQHAEFPQWKEKADALRKHYFEY